MPTVTTKISSLLRIASQDSGATPHEAHTAASIAVDLARKSNTDHLVAKALNAQSKAAARVACIETSEAIEPGFINPLYDMWASMQPIDWDNFEAAYEARRKSVSHYAWAVPTEDAIRRIIECGPVVEIGAGSGYWASLIAQLGGDVVAYDQYEPSENKDYPFEQGWFKVDEGGPEKAAEHSDRALFLCWPPYAMSFAFECLKAYQGDTVIFVGEGTGGCTGDDDFFQAIGEDTYSLSDSATRKGADDWEEVECVTIPQWEGLHDHMTIYRRKK